MWCGNFESQAYRLDTGSMDQVLDIVRETASTVEWVLDTHPYADHLMAAANLKHKNRRADGDRRKGADISKIWAEI